MSDLSPDFMLPDRLEAALRYGRHWLRGMLRPAKSNDAPLVYRAHGATCHTLVAVDAETAAAPLPNRLLLPAGHYRYGGQIYDCTAPGIYRFITPQRENRQHLVVAGSDAVTTALLAAQLVCRGNRDNFTTLRRLEQLAIHRFLILTCGPRARFVQHLLQQCGVSSRVVSTHSLAAANSYNNGHTLLEVWDADQGRYVLVDVDHGCYYTDGAGTIHTLLSLSRARNTDETVSTVLFTAGQLVDWTGFTEPATGFCYHMLEYPLQLTPSGWEQNMQHLCRIPLIMHEGRCYAAALDAAMETYVLQHHPDWEMTSPENFAALFYADAPQ